MKKILFTVFIVCLSLICLVALNKPETVEDCIYCYFAGDAHSNGAVHSLNSAGSYKCQGGKWIRTDKNEPYPGKAGSCLPCMYNGKKYSEGTNSNLNSMDTYRCIGGEWLKTNGANFY